MSATNQSATNQRFTLAQAGPAAAAAVATWRTPFLIIGFGCLISLLSFGPRSSLGFFLSPM